MALEVPGGGGAHGLGNGAAVRLLAAFARVLEEPPLATGEARRASAIVLLTSGSYFAAPEYGSDVPREAIGLGSYALRARLSPG